MLLYLGIEYYYSSLYLVYLSFFFYFFIPAVYIYIYDLLALLYSFFLHPRIDLFFFLSCCVFFFFVEKKNLQEQKELKIIVPLHHYSSLHCQDICYGFISPPPTILLNIFFHFCSRKNKQEKKNKNKKTRNNFLIFSDQFTYIGSFR